MDGLSTHCLSRRQKLTLRGSQFAHLEGLDFPDIKSSDVALLIGANVSEAILTLEVRPGGISQPYAVRTALG